MSLYQSADGILETHVTWQDVESEMQKALGTTAKFGVNKKATSIGDMKGFNSRIALIEADWDEENDDKDFPNKFVVKISTPLPFIAMTRAMNTVTDDFWNDEKLESMANMTRKLHNREVAAYKLLVSQKNPNIPITKIYASRSFNNENTLKGYIISEYFENLQNIEIHESILPEDLEQILKSVAAFSAIGEKLDRGEDLKFAGDNDFLNILLEQMYDEKSHEQSAMLLAAAFPPEYQEKAKQMVEILKYYYLKPEMLENYKNLCSFMGYRPVLTHSDLWGSNLLCTRGGEGKVNLKAIIDWQTVSFTTPAQDVGRLFVACLSKKDRREKLEELLELYYNTFIEELDGRPVPYTFQQLRDSYNLYFPLMAILVLPMIALLDYSQISESDLEELQKHAKDKMIGLMEDVIETHEWNIINYPDFFKN